MLNWLRLISFLLFCAVVYGKEVECDDVEYGDFCWNSTGVNFIKKCWRCQINEQQLATNESLIVSGKFEYLNIERVKIGGSITEIPNMFQKFTNKPIVEVSLFYKTKTTVLNSSFFVNSGENLIVFYVTMVEGLSVEGLTFQNCSSLEYLVLSFISLKIIPFDAFFGLNQLIMLDLGFNSLKNLHSKLFRDLENLKQLNLQANNLEEIPKDAFNKLKKLRKLDLYNNNITTISRKMFESNKQLNSINLGKNKIKIIQLDTFKYLNKLTKLYLKENNCTEMIFNNKPLVEVAEALTPCYPTNCIIPIIQNGHVISMKDNSTQTPGYFFKMFQSVKVICNPTYVLFNGKANQTGNKCLEQEWQEIEWPECVRVCPYKEINKMSISVSCEHEDRVFSCIGNLFVGTKATISCHTGYVHTTDDKNPELICLDSGQWSHKAHRCEPVCGLLITEDEGTNITDVPWHVAIYKDDEQICGGTIITERLVISAAHCFSKDIDNNHKIDYERFQVAAGKVKRDLDEVNSSETQIRNVQEIVIPPSYNGYVSWRADICTVTIVGFFEYQPNIAPACVEFFEYYSDMYPSTDTMALVGGWGLTKDDSSNAVLQAFEIPTVEFEVCLNSAPNGLKDKVIGDKICAGNLNSEESSAKVICQGDSGGGLLIPQTKDNKKRYYLQGVVSNSLTSCDTSFYTLFTNIQEYKGLVTDAINKTAKHLMTN